MRVLVASDHPDYATMFVTIVGVCGGVAWAVRGVAEAVAALGERPHVLLLDAALPDHALRVPAAAAAAEVAVVVFAHRTPDPHTVPRPLSVFGVTLLHSVRVDEVCAVLRAAGRRAA